MLDNLDFLVIKPAFPSQGMEPVFGGKLAGDERSRLIARMQASPHEFVGQELVNLSTVPVWSRERSLPAPGGSACVSGGRRETRGW